MTHTALRCRLCERTQPLTARSICPTCNGPLDVEYGLERLTLRTDGDGAPHSMWRYAELLPHVPADLSTPGLTPLVEAPRLSQALATCVPRTEMRIDYLRGVCDCRAFRTEEIGWRSGDGAG